MSGMHALEVVADVVDRERRQRGMSVAGLAQQARVDPATVRHLLAGRAVRVSTVRLVVLALGLEWEEFIGRLAGPSQRRIQTV